MRGISTSHGWSARTPYDLHVPERCGVMAKQQTIWVVDDDSELRQL